MRSAPDDFQVRSADDPPSLLVVVLDVSTSSWASLTGLSADQASHESASALQSVVEQLLVFMNSFLLLHNSNRVCVLLAAPDGAHLTYPALSDAEAIPVGFDSGQEDGALDVGAVNYDVVQNSEQVISSLRGVMMHGVKEAIQAQDGDKAGAAPEVSTALAKALCLHNRARRNKASRMAMASGMGADAVDIDDEQYNGRIFTVLAGQDAPEQYVPVMNCIFSAQRMGVAIDSCVLARDKDSTYFQQAAHLTNGVYSRPEEFSTKTPNVLIQLLQTVFLADRQSRDFLAMPTPEKVDFRASCMETMQIIEDGYTCSVCLSTFSVSAKGAALCPICSARFAVMPRVGRRPPKQS